MNQLHIYFHTKVTYVKPSKMWRFISNHRNFPFQEENASSKIMIYLLNLQEVWKFVLIKGVNNISWPYNSETHLNYSPYLLITKLPFCSSVCHQINHSKMAKVMDTKLFTDTNEILEHIFNIFIFWKFQVFSKGLIYKVRTVLNWTLNLCSLD